MSQDDAMILHAAVLAVVQINDLLQLQIMHADLVLSGFVQQTTLQPVHPTTVSVISTCETFIL